MRTFIVIAIIIIGLVLAVYVGLWIMFIGGIVQIIESVKATPVEAMGIAVGFVRVILASFSAGLCIVASFVAGLLILK